MQHPFMPYFCSMIFPLSLCTLILTGILSTLCFSVHAAPEEPQLNGFDKAGTKDSVSSTTVEFPASYKLATGPVIGHTTSNSVAFWALFKRAGEIHIALKKTGEPGTLQEASWTRDQMLLHGRYSLIKHQFGELQASSAYELHVSIDGTAAGIQTFKTFPDTELFDFDFLTGSCAMRPPQVGRRFFPGPQDAIYPVMQAVETDFMFWLGDNVYYLLRHMNVPEMMYERRIKKAQVPEIKEFLASRPHYAIWDDHDFGPNNQKGNFPLKDTSLFIHNSFWANPYHGLPDLKGIFTHFDLSDARFILLDNRYHSTPYGHAKPAMIGRGQMAWLKERLLESTATFNFIAVGSQALNLLDKGESWARYPEERQEILDFIEAEQIKNVIFLTGDRHHTELQKVEMNDGLIIYDFTCSPLTSALHKSVLTGHEANNPQRVPGTLVAQHNFGKVSVGGEEGARTCLIEVFDEKGEPLWQHLIRAQ